MKNKKKVEEIIEEIGGGNEGKKNEICKVGKYDERKEGFERIKKIERIKGIVEDRKRGREKEGIWGGR